MRSLYLFSTMTLVGCVAALSACGSSSGTVKPGKWQTTTEVESVDAPGLPASAVEQFKANAKGAAVETCLTEEMVSAPGGDIFVPKAGNCSVEKMEIKDGKIDSKMTCTVAGIKQQIVTNGTIQPEIYTLHSTISSSIPGIGATKTVAKVESKRIGDC